MKGLVTAAQGGGMPCKRLVADMQHQREVASPCAGQQILDRDQVLGVDERSGPGSGKRLANRGGQAASRTVGWMAATGIATLSAIALYAVARRRAAAPRARRSRG